MPIEITSLNYEADNISEAFSTITTESIQVEGKWLRADTDKLMPYLVMRAVDLETGEIINDLTPKISGSSDDPEKLWGLRCLSIYPALLCIRQLACIYRRGDKRRHYAGALKFAARMQADPYGDEELTEHLMKAWKCHPDRYPFIHSLIPANQIAAFTDGAWMTLNRSGVMIAGDTEADVALLRHFKLLA